MIEEAMRRLAADIEADLFNTLCGAAPKPRRPTALRLRGRTFEVVELDDYGKVIEPPRPCYKCGPILLCAEHTAMVT